MSKPALVVRSPFALIFWLFGVMTTGGLLSLVIPSHITAVQEENRRQIFLSSMAEAGSILGLLIYTLLICHRFLYLGSEPEGKKTRQSPFKKRRPKPASFPKVVK
ncbi:MAG: hypothetical protein Q7S03_04340 [bacterium]|nr:hypothetical protein [bacterium]